MRWSRVDQTCLTCVPDAFGTVSGGSVPDVTGHVRYGYRTRPVFWPGVGRVAEVTRLWLIAVTEH